MTSPFLLHPMAVHLALSLGLFSAVAEFFPRIKERLPRRFRRRFWGLTLLFLSLALLTGFLSFSSIKERHIPLPLEVSIHGWVALSGGVLFLLLRLLTEEVGKRRPGTIPSRQLLAGAGLLALLAAATLGGQLVYKDRLGTAYMAGRILHPPLSKEKERNGSREETIHAERDQRSG